ncbi:CDP-alcohol phosphatidyltransferase family protein [Thermosulfurimonas dismutans]|uniref:CDP-diacylglycerol--glycerol-3-phosphate 3-phosphatidyltransferase n=1 Tax=Thermosulfurimonas dismutans TaxID=999894 RepID=A0A179D6P1_9BACT|nr:CDP-alcohol phosphatidyltransferase family protein [Thermosulfurimonas dismutans]OAQ21770.1 CDP-diacylglycerol--glycerol-3-phosphate 3-phosphatidyltransferase [Thermosulfurimonas dismutans]
MTFTEKVKTRSEPFLLPLVRALARVKIPPNAVSIAGFIGVGLAGLAIALGHIGWGGILLLVFGPLDAVDGLLARKTNQASTFGAFLDSTLDRYAEIALFLGLTYYFLKEGSTIGVLLSFLTLTGSLMVSYARARAEGLKMECKVGLFTRFERLLALTLGLVTGFVLPVLVILALLTHYTALQRILHVYRQSRK